MNGVQPLLPAALVGTERHAGPWPPEGAWPPAVAAVVAEAAAAAEVRATGLLRAAGVVALAQAAGELGADWHAPLPVPAPAEVLPAPAATAALGWLLQEGPARLQHELCATLAAAGLRLPEAWLPAALEAGRRSVALREHLVPVLGERGLWLATQHDGWRWAAGAEAAADDDTRWAEGSLEQRRELLRRQRGAAPAAARERLAAALPELPANERAELAAVLADGLSPADETLLDSLRGDRSREVRQAALQLLLRLPGSAHAGRAAARVAALLQQERVLLRRRWVLAAPLEAAADWKDEGIDTVRPRHETLGERAWWLYQLVRQVPLAWWTAHTGLRPAELLAWAAAGDWAEALHRAWRDVLFAAPEPTWCAAFVQQWPAGAGRDDSAALLARLPLAEREAHWQRLLEQAGTLSDDLLLQLAEGCPPAESLSAGLSAAVVVALGQRLAAQPLAHDWRLREALPAIACVLHPGQLAPLKQLPRPPDETPALEALLHAVQRIATAREALSTLRTP